MRHGVRWGLAVVLLAAQAGCGWFGGGEPPDAGAPLAQVESQGEPADGAAASADGVLASVAAQAPPGSASQHLAELAASFGWEEQVARDEPLKRAVAAGQFDERVEPHLLALFYRNGFSVLPLVGEGHQFNRDSVVRGAVSASRLLVTTREPVRIILLGMADNVQIVYPQDGTPPEVYAVQPDAVVAVRESLLGQYLR